MKKWLKRLLIVLLVLVAAVVLIRIISPDPTYFMTEEACAQCIVGVWEDPLGDYKTYEFRADGTGRLGDLPITWEIDHLVNKGGGIDYDLLFVHCTTEGNSNMYSVAFHYFSELDFWEASSYYIYDADGKEGRGSEEDLYPEVQRKSNVMRYKADTWELVELDEDNWETYFKIDQRETYRQGSNGWEWTYDNYVVLRPEYARITRNLGNLDYTYRCVYDYQTTPYFATGDATTKKVTLGDKNPDVQGLTGRYEFPHTKTYQPCLPNDIHIKDWAFGAELDRITILENYTAKTDGYVHVIEKTQLLYAQGRLLLAKVPDVQ